MSNVNDGTLLGQLMTLVCSGIQQYSTLIALTMTNLIMAFFSSCIINWTNLPSQSAFKEVSTTFSTTYLPYASFSLTHITHIFSQGKHFITDIS